MFVASRSLVRVSVVVVALCALQAHTALAQENSKSPLDDSYFALKLMLGLGGSVSNSGASVNIAGTTVSGSGSTSNDLNPSFGGGVQYMVPLHRYFALGGLFALQSWQEKAAVSVNNSRNLFFDLSIVPQGKLPLTNTIELYLSVPIGITLDIWNQASNSVTVAGVTAGTSADTGIGYNLSLLFGARFALSRGIGLLAELGYTRHAVSHTIKGSALGAGGNVDVDRILEQFALNAGVFFDAHAWRSHAFVVDPAAMTRETATPRSLGYRPVGEWESNAACWSAWPAHEYAWGEHLRVAQREFVGFCQALLAEDGAESLQLLVADDDGEHAARTALNELGERVHYRRLQYGDIWLRDTTPLFVRGEAGLACVRFGFNGWGNKYQYPGDRELAARLCDERGLPSFAFDSILEGGSVELDGEGTCLATESCLLNPNRGEGLTRARLDHLLKDALAVDKVLWLKDGLTGDHTDGHIDNIARFVAAGVVAHMRALDDDDPNRATLEAIESDLRSFTDAAGRKLRLVSIPAPGRVSDLHGEPIAASYLNFYIGNRSVIVPSFDSEYDAPAREAIAAIFPDRKVVSRSARAILEGGGGTFHCMTRQEPGATR